MNDIVFVFVFPYIFSFYPLIVESAVQFVHDIASDFLENE